MKRNLEAGNTAHEEAAKTYREELLRLRRWLHSHPELSMQERQTSRFIADYLEGLGIPRCV